jgi:hypothetical protein
MMDDSARRALREVADAAPTPVDLRGVVQRRVAQRRRRAVGTTACAVAAAIGVVFASMNAIDDNPSVEIVPATNSGGASTSTEPTTTQSTVDTGVPVQVSPPDPHLPGSRVVNPTDSWIAASLDRLLTCPVPLPAPRCDATGWIATLAIVAPGAGDVVTLPRSGIGEISWIVVDAPRERIFFGVTSGCDPGDNGTWMIGFDGVTPRKVSDSGARPAVSPDGRFLAHSEHTDGCGSRRLVVEEIETGRGFSYDADVSLTYAAWIDDGRSLLVGVEDDAGGALRFPVSETGSIADPQTVNGLDGYALIDAAPDTELFARVCPSGANCTHWILGYAIARDGVIEREIPCPRNDCDRAGEPRLDPSGTEIMWVSTDFGAWGVDGLGTQELRPHTSDDGFALLISSGIADW